MELNLRHILRIARQYWWLVVVLTLVGGGTAFLRSSNQPDMYATSSRVLVLGEENDTVSSYTAQLASQNLLETYRQLVESDTILQSVVDNLELSYSYVDLDKHISTSVITDTLLIEIRAEDTDPERAAAIADETARQFQAYIAANQDNTLSSPVTISAEARVPSTPFEPNPAIVALLGILVGLLLGIAVIAVLEFLDNTVRPGQDFQELTSSPLLATIPNLPGLKSGGNQVFSVAQPRSAAAESMRHLRTNLEFAAASSEINRLVVSSSDPDEGKSTVVANIGVVLAQGGMRVVIVDADLRRPTQHRIFGVSGEEGLTTLLTHPERSWHSVARRVAVANLSLVTSGPIPPNPFDLVSSRRFVHLLEVIGQDADLIVIDAPPILAASDSLAIAVHTDGMIVVCHSRKTRTDALRHSTQTIEQAGSRCIGVVLNRNRKQKGATHYGDHSYTSDPPATTDAAAAAD